MGGLCTVGSLSAQHHVFADVDAACKVLESSGIAPQVMVDVSHANRSKQHAKQNEVAQDVAVQVVQKRRVKPPVLSLKASQ
jgi:3-deoxy-7-phosphoheptulonate synthase